MTNVSEIATGIYRISTPVSPDIIPGGFTFNQFLIVDDAPVLFHTGPKKMFPLVQEAVTRVLGDVSRLRYVGFSHFEADECGSLNEWLALAPKAEPLCSMTAAMVSVNDTAIRAARPMMDGEELSIGSKSLRWLDAPHVPHNWECGYLFESTTRTLLCGDILTQLGHDVPALTTNDVVEASVAAHRAGMSGMGADANARKIFEKLASTEPLTLARMHGPSFQGNGAKQLLAFADSVLA